MPVSLVEPIWDQSSMLLPAHPDVDPTHPLGSYRRRILDRNVFNYIVAALAHGPGDEHIGSPGCSDRTIRRRLQAWAEAGLCTRWYWRSTTA